MNNYDLKIRKKPGKVPRVVIRPKIITFEMRARKVIYEFQSLPLKFREIILNELKSIGTK